ncbi:MAG: carboxypeptidase M32 [Anaerolineales bacterium]|nr:carboxypeptidase M32 [Anaerolineales bacterium]
MSDLLNRLKARLAEIEDVEYAAAILEWDQFVMMPPAGGEGRSYQYATLQKLAHELYVTGEMGRLIEALGRAYASAPADDDDAALVRVVERQYRRKTRIPAALVAETFQATSFAQEVWARARANNDFGAFQPHLERIFDLKRQVAACFPEVEAPYDALLDEYEPGMRTSQVRAMFAELKAELVPLVQAIAARPPIDDSVLRRGYAPADQLAASQQVLERFGYDFSAGRQDLSVHPFCTGLGLRDVRVTTRVDPNYLSTCLMGSMHECGHALYELGFPARHARTPLAHGASLGIHESQSRMWENLVGRSREFWGFFYPRLQAIFPGQLGQAPLEIFYRAINRVTPSLIRVEADEVTYNLHTLLRFELEVELLDGRLAAADAPAAWNAKVKECFGLDVPDNRLGVLQDTHWAAGLIGYFPTYTIGNLASVQFFNQALADVPRLSAEIARGEFAGLLSWLRHNVHAHGCKYLPADLVQRVTGRPLGAKDYLGYLKKKYSALYGL